jgi:hypothetical protein
MSILSFLEGSPLSKILMLAKIGIHVERLRREAQGGAVLASR